MSERAICQACLGNDPACAVCDGNGTVTEGQARKRWGSAYPEGYGGTVPHIPEANLTDDQAAARKAHTKASPEPEPTQPSGGVVIDIPTAAMSGQGSERG